MMFSFCVVFLLFVPCQGFAIHRPVLIRAEVPVHSLRIHAETPNGGADLDPSLKLLLCLVIDFVGIASFAAPGIGESTDLAWAPVSAFLVNYLFGNGLIASIAFVEEFLPGFDVIPTATIAWFLDYLSRTSDTQVKERGGQPPPKRNRKTTILNDDDDFIDVTSSS